MGTNIAPSHDGYRVHQDLLQIVAQNLGIEVDGITESSYALVDILMASGPF